MRREVEEGLHRVEHLPSVEEGLSQVEEGLPQVEQEGLRHKGAATLATATPSCSPPSSELDAAASANQSNANHNPNQRNAPPAKSRQAKCGAPEAEEVAEGYVFVGCVRRVGWLALPP